MRGTVPEGTAGEPGQWPTGGQPMRIRQRPKSLSGCPGSRSAPQYHWQVEDNRTSAEGRSRTLTTPLTGVPTRGLPQGCDPSFAFPGYTLWRRGRCAERAGGPCMLAADGDLRAVCGRHARTVRSGGAGVLGMPGLVMQRQPKGAGTDRPALSPWHQCSTLFPLQMSLRNNRDSRATSPTRYVPN
jgi:hypothetical protein